MNRPTIYTVGDSHGWHAWLKIPNVSTSYIRGPMTMHSFGQLMNGPLNRSFLESIPLDGIICFSLGEIDCRCHVHRFQPWQATIDKLVEDYISAIDNCIYDRNPKRIWIYFVVPPIREIAAENPYFPFVGTLEERIAYVKYMNKKLKESKYTFIDLYDKYSNEDGSMIYADSDANVHIENPEHIIEWINNESLYTFTE